MFLERVMDLSFSIFSEVVVVELVRFFQQLLVQQ